ncbi:MAG TPA: hypothetical protein ENJ29_13730 [Bacteroidetes bacterium]|nr:hypothetical protein [Bacteroidota bacterium]
MSTGQIILVVLATLAVARAFIILGELNYPQRWLNYPIAVAAGLVGASLSLRSALFDDVALLVCLAFATGALALYHLVRWQVLRAMARRVLELDESEQPEFSTLTAQN